MKHGMCVSTKLFIRIVLNALVRDLPVQPTLYNEHDLNRPTQNFQEIDGGGYTLSVD